MGCAMSNTSDRSSNPRVFDVANIDDGGQERNAGKIEVSDNELILHYPGRESIRWPLQSLRRYGYNDNLFSFESGRRCPTGHGIYAFRCASAELLFQQLQQSILRAGEERARTAAETANTDHDHYATTDWATGAALQQQQQRATAGRLDNRFADYINCPHFSSSWRTYVNQNIMNHRANELVTSHVPSVHAPVTSEVRPSFTSRGSVQYADLDLPGFCDVIELEDYDDEVEVFQPPEVTSQNSLRPAYVNVPITSGNAISLFSRDSRTWQANDAIVPLLTMTACAERLTYAQLDLDSPSETPGLGPSPDGTTLFPASTDFRNRGKPETYAAIDFQRTRALSTRTAQTEDEGFRKTRHNSNIEMLTRN